MNNILIVEDERINTDFLSNLLISFGHNVIGIAKSAEDTLKILASNACDFIFMDVNIRGAIDGIALAKQVNKTEEMPIIFMTAFGDSQTISEASETNIYGFVIKPFNPSHIEAVLSVTIARINKEKKKRNPTLSLAKSILDLGNGYEYNCQSKTLYFQNNTIHLSKNEAKLLCLLCSNYEHIISFETLRSTIWAEKNITDSTIRDTICRIRKKTSGLSIENISGIGYLLRKEKN
jgi:DNA-binding response OmpR family regulator